MAGALLVGAAEGRADGRRCPRALGNRWVAAARTTCECLAAAEPRAAVQQRQVGEERGMDNSMSMRM